MGNGLLPDGRYDVFIVWAEAREGGRIAFDLTLTTGERKGEVITVLARSDADPISCVGLPARSSSTRARRRLDFE